MLQVLLDCVCKYVVTAVQLKAGIICIPYTLKLFARGGRLLTHTAACILLVSSGCVEVCLLTACGRVAVQCAAACLVGAKLCRVPFKNMVP
jgi:hypothetical protein